MKKIILTLAILASITCAPRSAAGMAPNALAVDRMVQKYSLKYEVDPNDVWAVLWCESGFDFYAVGDHGESFGIAQIHLKDHPSITKAEALDPDFSTDFLARQISLGRGWQWTCYRIMVLAQVIHISVI